MLLSNLDQYSANVIANMCRFRPDDFINKEKIEHLFWHCSKGIKGLKNIVFSVNFVENSCNRVSMCFIYDRCRFLSQDLFNLKENSIFQVEKI